MNEQAALPSITAITVLVRPYLSDSVPVTAVEMAPIPTRAAAIADAVAVAEEVATPQPVRAAAKNGASQLRIPYISHIWLA